MLKVYEKDYPVCHVKDYEIHASFRGFPVFELPPGFLKRATVRAMQAGMPVG
jgi:hypothetical protein